MKYMTIWEISPEYPKEFNQLRYEEIVPETIVPSPNSKIVVDSKMYSVSEVIVDYDRTDAVSVYCYAVAPSSDTLKHHFSRSGKESNSQTV